MSVNLIEVEAPVCSGGPARLKAIANGRLHNPRFVWSTGETTRFIYGQQGQKYSVTIYDESGCPATDSITVSTLPNTKYTPRNFTVTKPNAVTFTGTWNPAPLEAGVNLIGYSMAYRQVGVVGGAPWTTTPLSISPTATVSFSGSGKPSANYEFTAFARVNDNGTIYNTANACFERKFYNGSGNKTETAILNDVESTSVHIYPNPTNDFVFVQAESGATVRLMDIGGRILQSKDVKDAEISFDLSHMAAGTYLIQVISTTDINVAKVLKE